MSIDDKRKLSQNRQYVEWKMVNNLSEETLKMLADIKKQNDDNSNDVRILSHDLLEQASKRLKELSDRLDKVRLS